MSTVNNDIISVIFLHSLISHYLADHSGFCFVEDITTDSSPTAIMEDFHSAFQIGITIFQSEGSAFNEKYTIYIYIGFDDDYDDNDDDDDDDDACFIRVFWETSTYL